MNKKKRIPTNSGQNAPISAFLRQRSAWFFLLNAYFHHQYFLRVVVTSRCHQALKRKNWLVSLTSCPCIFMWHRAIHHKGKFCKMLLVANVFFLTLLLIWNWHESIHLPTDSSSARSAHIIPIGNWSLFCTWWDLHFGKESEGLETETDSHPRFILFRHRKNVEIPSCCMKWPG